MHNFKGGVMQDSKTGVIVLGLIVGIVLGGALGYSMWMMGKDKSMSTQQSSTGSSMSKESEDGVTVGGARMVSNLDIVDNAANAKNVTTLVDLVKQADLVETLKGVGPFTVFGPTNDAFDKVPKDTLNKIAGDKELLKTVLTYHVVPGTYTTADLRAMAAKGESVMSVQGEKLSFKVSDGKVFVVDATGQEVEIETADVVSSNGVTHVVKNVLLPVDPSTL